MKQLIKIRLIFYLFLIIQISFANESDLSNLEEQQDFSKIKQHFLFNDYSTDNQRTVPESPGIELKSIPPNISGIDNKVANSVSNLRHQYPWKKIIIKTLVVDDWIPLNGIRSVDDVNLLHNNLWILLPSKPLVKNKISNLDSISALLNNQQIASNILNDVSKILLLNEQQIANDTSNIHTKSSVFELKAVISDKAKLKSNLLPSYDKINLNKVTWIILNPLLGINDKIASKNAPFFITLLPLNTKQIASLISPSNTKTLKNNLYLTNLFTNNQQLINTVLDPIEQFLFTDSQHIKNLYSKLQNYGNIAKLNTNIDQSSLPSNIKKIINAIKQNSNKLPPFYRRQVVKSVKEEKNDPTVDIIKHRFPKKQLHIKHLNSLQNKLWQPNDLLESHEEGELPKIDLSNQLSLDSR